MGYPQIIQSSRTISAWRNSWLGDHPSLEPISFFYYQNSAASGWWLTYPSEKYDFVSWDDDIPNIWKNKSHVPNHQPVINWFELSRFRPGPVHPKVSTVSQSHSQPVALDLRQPLSQIHSLAQSVPWLCRLKSKRCTLKIWRYYSLDWIKGKSTGNPYIR